MSTETEIKLSLSASTASRLLKHGLLCGIEPQRQLLINTYYDTPDGRLRDEKVVVRYRRKGREWLFGVKTSVPLSGGLAQRKEWEAPGLPGEFDFSQVDDSILRDLLEALRDQLQPLFITRFRRIAWLLEPRPGVRIEVALDRGWIDAGGRRATICEVELELLAGAVSDLFELASALQTSLPLHPEAISKSGRAYRLLAAAPITAVKALPVPIWAGLSTINAFRLVALSCLNHLQCNEQGVCESDAPEFVHQARVAIRRLRSAIRVWERQLPAPFVARFDPLWQGLAKQLGEARNWDVFLESTAPILGAAFPDSVELAQLVRYAGRRRASTRKAARSVFKSADYSRLLLDFTGALLALPEAGDGRLGTAVPGWLNKTAKRVSQRAEHALGPDYEARHRLRLAFKQLRYALEFFSPIFSPAVLQDYQQSVTALQELLGSQNDLAVAMQLTREALPGTKADVVHGWLAAQSDLLLPELGTLLEAFRQQGTPWAQWSP